MIGNLHALVHRWTREVDLGHLVNDLFALYTMNLFLVLVIMDSACLQTSQTYHL